MKRLMLLAWILLMAMCCGAQERRDLEALPLLRTQQYPAPYDRIVVFSAPRTGSSVVYNIFRFLFESDSKIFAHHHDFVQDNDRKVFKTHRFYELDWITDKNVLFVFTLRNPIDASISNFRICTRTITSNKAFAQALIERHQSYLEFSEKLEHQGTEVARLKYEDYAGNRLNHVFDFIEDHFHMVIAPEDRVLMKEGYSKENVYANTQEFNDFNAFLDVSGFHGLHVNLEGYTPPEDFVYWLNVYVEAVKPLFRRYGYFTEQGTVVSD